ncbi:molybdate ABC transporter substrate-binding protein [Micrococcoides hystricis]|uniref:Molybdate ABC transporter substrate-binding protein n=1 Tax=Micrococcoides hystricis TaxID=1572761 RepID=A0ABV6PA30_9MICC
MQQRTTLLARLAALSAAGLLALTACGSPSGQNDGQDGAGSDGAGAITVSAAASLTDVIEELETEYQKEHEDFALKTNLGASSKLVQQINEGQDAQLLITADEDAIKTLDESLNYENDGRVVTNTLVLAVSNDWAEKQDSDQATSDPHYVLENAKVAICAPDVPCGRNTAKWLDKNKPEGFQATTEEDNVRNTLSKVVAGEVDAAFVYATDQATARDTTTAVTLPGAEVQGYPLMVSPDASQQAKDFAAWLKEDTAQSIFEDAGFGSPDAN